MLKAYKETEIYEDFRKAFRGIYRFSDHDKKEQTSHLMHSETVAVLRHISDQLEEVSNQLERLNNELTYK